MLKTPSIFPEVGSWGLYEADGTAHPARVVERPSADSALISLADNPMLASGNLTVPLAALRDATPLSLEEREERDALHTHIGRLAWPERSRKADRFRQLCEREVRAQHLVNLLAALERRRGVATPATRAARRSFEAAIAAGKMRRAA